MKIATKVKKEEWEIFLKKYPVATIYYTPEWEKVLEKTFGYEPRYLFALGDTEEILGMLPLFYVKSRIFGNRLSCLPFSHVCGYIGIKSAQKELIHRALEIQKNIKAKYLEIRSSVGNTEFEEVGGFYTYVLELSDEPLEVFKKLKTDVKRSIKKARQNNLVVEIQEDLDILEEYWKINCSNKKRLGAPCYPLKFFEEIIKILKNNSRLYIAKYKDNIIGGGIFLYYKDTVIYGYGAADHRYLKLRPYHAFIWKAIEDACMGGYTNFDFGRASISETGLREFKRRWGTKEIALKYSFYSNSGNSHLVRSEVQNNFVYSLGRPIVSRSPWWIYKKGRRKFHRKLGVNI